MKNKVIMLAMLGSCLLFAGLINYNPMQDFTLDTIHIVKNADIKPNTNNLTSAITISLPYISDFNNSKISKKINKEIIKSYLGENYMNCTPKNAADQYAHDFLSQLTGIENSLLKTKDELKHNFFIQNIVKGEIINNRILCIENFYAESNGKLKTKLNYQNIDLKTGKVIALKDIFEKNYEASLKGIIINKIFEALQIQENRVLKDAEIIKLEHALNISNNFKINSSGLSFYYSLPNWVKNCKSEISITLPNNIIGELLKKEYQFI